MNYLGGGTSYFHNMCVLDDIILNLPHPST